MKQLFNFYSKNKKVILILSIILFFIFLLLPICTIRNMRINSPYTTKEDVALYIMQHHELPPNYITKGGYKYLSNNNLPCDKYIIGGDLYYNDGKLNDKGISDDINLKECDITSDQYNIENARGALRLVYTCNTKNVRVFFTSDHYDSFTELSKFKLQLTSNVFWIIFGIYVLAISVFYILILIAKKQNQL